ncbi:MAG: hypothetical protein NTU83_03670 [Candidatus Hydrogenedentes bacterium]|nr:hypothetical protein [Candidatus Hydrogenedentota bacterium]
MTAGRARRWGPLLGALACLAILGVVDTALKLAPVTGYCPDAVQWVLSTEDAGTFCSSFAGTRVGREAAKAFGEFLGHFQRDVRFSVGIRPTILRWRVWMGNYLVIASTPNGTGASVRPGVLLWTAERIRRLLKSAPESGGVSSYGSWYYGWHRGFLVFSVSKDYVEAALNGQSVRHSGARDAILFRSLGADGLSVAVRGASGIPISGSVRSNVQHGSTPLTLPESWPNSPILSVSVRKPAELAGLAQVARPWLAGPRAQLLAAYLETIWRRWEMPDLGEGWDAGISETSLALTDVDMESVVPVPVLSCIMRGGDSVRGKHPLEAIADNSPSYPAEWNGEPGLRIPWLGEGLTLCLGRSGRDWLATSREPAMAQLAAERREGPDVDADVTLRLDWTKAGRVLSQVMPRLADWGLLPEMNQRDAEHRFGPLFDFLSKLGKASVNGHRERDQLVFDGFLSKPLDAKP